MFVKKTRMPNPASMPDHAKPSNMSSAAAQVATYMLEQVAKLSSTLYIYYYLSSYFTLSLKLVGKVK